MIIQSRTVFTASLCTVLLGMLATFEAQGGQGKQGVTEQRRREQRAGKEKQGTRWVGSMEGVQEKEREGTGKGQGRDR